MERNLKDRLLEESRYPKETKDEIWDKLEARLDMEPATPKRASRTNHRRNNTMKKIKITTGVAAATLAVAVFLSAPAGTAFMQDVKSWFAPEKKVEIEVEGEKEETDQKLHQNEDSQYVIYYDQERYKLVEEDGKDVITTKEPLPDMYPEVSMTIEQFKDVKPEDLVKQLSETLTGKYADVKEIETVSEPVEGYRVRALNGQEWDSEVIVIYVTSNQKEGSFAFTGKYFLEASEGHGARFEQMLQQFQIVE